MLVELTVENLAIIERAHIALGPGFTVLTGDTSITTNGSDADFSDTTFSSDSAGPWTLTIDTRSGTAADEGNVILGGADNFGGKFLSTVLIEASEVGGAGGTAGNLTYRNDYGTSVSITNASSDARSMLPKP